MPQVSILCAGDSLTMGSPGYEGSYRRPLGNSAPNLHFVGSQLSGVTFGGFDNGDGGYHEGYSGGEIADEGPNTLTQIDVYDPSVVLIWFGTNEVSADTEDAAVYYQFAVDCLAKASVSKVIVGTCAPRRSDHAKYAQQNTYRDAVNTHFQTTQAPLPAGMYHCDPGAVIDSDDYFADALHLTQAGYDLCAPVWLAALTAAGVELTESDAGTDCGDVI